MLLLLNTSLVPTNYSTYPALFTNYIFCKKTKTNSHKQVKFKNSTFSLKLIKLL